MIGTAEAGRLFSTQPAEIRRDELTEYAEQVDQAGKVVLHRTFSPAELACGLAESLLHAEESGDLPYATQRRDVLGPHSRPITGREADIVSHADLLAAARRAVEAVSSEGALPGNVRAGDARLGLGQLAAMLARAYLVQARYAKFDRIRVPKTSRYPDEAFELDVHIHRNIGEHWAYETNFTREKLAEHARLQTWTLKPAWLSPPRGRTRPENRILL